MADGHFTRSGSESEWRFACADTTLVGTARGAGPPIVLLHGGPGLYDYFAGSVMLQWLEQNHTVWRYDQRGGGRSSTPDDLTIDAHTTDLESIRQQKLAESITLLGHSWGGVLACHYAATYPERVDRLILMSTTGVSTDWRPAFQHALLCRMNDATRRRIQELEERIAAAPHSADARQLHVQRLNILVPLYVADGHRQRAPHIKSFNPDAYAVGFETADRRAATPEFTKSIARVNAPVHIIHGESDCIPMTVVDDLVGAFPNTRAHRLADCGHFPWIEQPDECRKVVTAALEGA